MAKMGSPKNLIVALFLCSLCTRTFAVDYYPQGYFNSADVTKVTWAHGVNSNASLEASLRDNGIQMLEADLVMGTVKGGSNETQVIMAHPPANESDLSFAMFLDCVIEYNTNLTLKSKKGIKLDFKEFEAARLAIPMIHDKYMDNREQVEFPIWINADILTGPINASESKVNGTDLITLQKRHLPNATLSIGWTTKFGLQGDGSILRNGSYTREHFDEMVELITTLFPDVNRTAAITFPLRAGLALNSLEEIKYLLDESAINHTNPSVTLWEGAADPPLELQELNAFIAEINQSRVFVDLPYTLNGSEIDSSGWKVKSESTVLATLLTMFAFHALF